MARRRTPLSSLPRGHCSPHNNQWHKPTPLRSAPVLHPLFVQATWSHPNTQSSLNPSRARWYLSQITTCHGCPAQWRVVPRSPPRLPLALTRVLQLLTRLAPCGRRPVPPLPPSRTCTLTRMTSEMDSLNPGWCLVRPLRRIPRTPTSRIGLWTSICPPVWVTRPCHSPHCWLGSSRRAHCPTLFHPRTVHLTCQAHCSPRLRARACTHPQHQQTPAGGHCDCFKPSPVTLRAHCRRYPRSWVSCGPPPLPVTVTGTM